LRGHDIHAEKVAARREKPNLGSPFLASGTHFLYPTHARLLSEGPSSSHLSASERSSSISCSAPPRPFHIFIGEISLVYMRLSRSAPPNKVIAADDRSSPLISGDLMHHHKIASASMRARKALIVEPCSMPLAQHIVSYHVVLCSERSVFSWCLGLARALVA